MTKRKLRIVKTIPDVLGVCERCKSQFASIRPDVAEAQAEIITAFDAHKCRPLDSSQIALRIVRESTENK